MANTIHLREIVLGKNILFSISGDGIATFTVDLKRDFGPSQGTGKTRIIASSGSPKHIAEDIIATLHVMRVVVEERGDDAQNTS